MDRRQRVALVCLTPDIGALGTPFELPSYGIRRIQAALLADPERRKDEIILVDSSSYEGIIPTPQGAERFAAVIEEIDPDVVGFSVYLWSFPFLLEVARLLKQTRPDRFIVFGGPSARPAMFHLEPFREAAHFVDALVIREGEETIKELLSLRERSQDALAEVKGIALPTPEGWHETPERPLIDPLDRIASPYAMGLMPYDQVGYLETYRGCPLSCRFCEWGIGGGAKRVFSTEYITRELKALKQYRAKGMFLLDAGLNLNKHAFRNLRAAEREAQFLRGEGLLCDVYPSEMDDEYFEFFREIRPAYLGVGLQSYSKSVLDGMQRPFKEERFERVVGKLVREGLPVEVQLILGLPGDNPESFLYTFERARGLGAHVRVFHCVVLPDALMTRGLPEFQMRFDPYSLKMISCLGWTAEDFSRVRSYLLGVVQDDPHGIERNSRDARLAAQYLDPLDRPQGLFYPGPVTSNA